MRALLAAALLSACASAHVTGGRDFDAGQVSRIVPGRTTKAELLDMFGEPYSKTVISPIDEIWLYSYTDTTASARSYLVTVRAEADTKRKSLRAVIKDGVVAYYNFTDAPGRSGAIAR